MNFSEKTFLIISKLNKRLKYYSNTKNQLGDSRGTKVAEMNLDSFLLNKDMGRYSFILCQLLNFSGFKVAIKLDPMFFWKEMPYKKMLLDQNFVRVRNSGVLNNHIALHTETPNKKYIRLLYGYDFIENKTQAYYLPYPLHPRFYQEFSCPDFIPYREAESKVRILFAGNFERTLYKNNILGENFESIISRVDVIDHIKSHYANDPRMIISPTKKDFYERLENKSIGAKFIIAEVKTNQEDWLRLLSSGDFFLCLPGVKMPWAHNAIEAMAVGTIPIIQYNKLFQPYLDHLENCLVFDSYNTLISAIEIALNMNEQDIKLMKRQVIDYYNKYLAYDQTVNQIKTFLNSKEETLNIVIPYLNDDRS